MQNRKNSYGNDSLSTLSEKNKVRLRPGVIFGSDGIEGCQHTLSEIVGNSRDEANMGYGDRIMVNRFSDHSIEVIDFGRGIPIEYNEKEEKYNWEIVFTILYGGGKYENNLGGSSYKFSVGLNGLGTAATQFASEYMEVEVVRDGFQYNLSFKEGDNVTEDERGFTKIKNTGDPTGTRIRWKPDYQVFNEIDVPLEYFQKVLKRQAIVNKGITFELFDESSEETFEYYYRNGITDYLKEMTMNTGFTDIKYYEGETRGKDREDKPVYDVKIEIAFRFDNENPFIEYYHNSSYLAHGGSPDRAVKNAFVAQIDKMLKEKNLYNKGEKKITFGDIEDSLSLISNSFSTETSYENQTKKAITNAFIQQTMTEFLKEKLEIYFIENVKDTKLILDQVLINKRSREKAEKTRIDIKKKLNKKIDSITNKPKKFVDCRSKDKKKRELFIVEGDSALGSTKMGRDADFQGIMPVRGKILNCLKSDYDKIFKNDIIVDLLKVLECGVELKSKQKDLNTFEIDKLNWNRIIICTDADVDGFQIRTLILTMLYVLTPTLIKEGYVYIVESPLYEITDGKNNVHFAFDEKEKREIVGKIKGKYTLQRSKGLGENEADMMWKTTMNPETRRLIQVTPTDVQRTKEAFDLFLGDNLEGRKAYIEAHGSEYIDDVDII